jgi:hypothetical protein
MMHFNLKRHVLQGRVPLKIQFESDLLGDEVIDSCMGTVFDSLSVRPMISTTCIHRSIVLRYGMETVI